MISNFPTALPGELFYSVCARFAYRMEYPNLKNVAHKLFGSANALAVVDLPSHLQHFVDGLPEGHSLKQLDTIINTYTLLPYYRPFRSANQVKRAWSAMVKSGSVHGALGLMANRVDRPKFLRFCPECTVQDRQRNGEAYWHRLHQVPGVLVCPQHNFFLCDSSAQVRQQQTRYMYVRADKSIGSAIEVGIDLNNPEHRKLLRIALDTEELLKHPDLTPMVSKSFGQRYLYQLALKDLATYSGRIRINQLIEDFISFYGEGLLQTLGCSINAGSQHVWPAQLIRRPSSSQHPLHHLLLIQFMGLTVSEFLNSSPAPKYFGFGPWPCLNSTCASFRQRTIKTYRLTFTKDHGKPVGTFSCTCGFSYSRTGPDQSPEDMYRIDRMVAYGFDWENQLRHLWLDGEVSLRELSRRLGVDPSTARKQSVRLELPKTRPGGKADHPKLRYLSQSRKDNLLDEATLEQKQREWLNLCEANPDASTNELRALAQALYAWLYRHDKGWLQQNLPSISQPRKVPRVDWWTRDQQFAQQVPLAVSRLKESKGPIRQITVAAIAREIGQLSTLQKHLDKLPLTKKVLQQHTESREAFAIRRIAHAVRVYQAKGECPPMWRLVRESGLRPEVVEASEVQVALEKAMLALTSGRVARAI